MIKGAIIGLGKIARTAHIPAYNGSKVGGCVRIIAGVDISEENRTAFRKLMPGVNVYSTIDEMYEKDTVDFIDICVPPNLHVKYIEFAIRKNINVICEKPLSSELNSAVTLKFKLLNTGIIFRSFHQYKYSPVWKIFKSAVESMKDANRIFLQFNVYRLAADSGFDSNNPGWRTDSKASGGGILSDTGSHYFYLTDYLLGKPLEISSHNFKLRKFPYEVEDTSITIITAETGIAQINLTWAAAKRMNSAFMTDGQKSLVYDGTEINIFENGCSRIIEVPDASEKSTYIGMYENLILDFVSDCINGTNNKETALESFDVIKMLHCSYESSRMKKTVKF